MHACTPTHAYMYSIMFITVVTMEAIQLHIFLQAIEKDPQVVVS